MGSPPGHLSTACVPGPWVQLCDWAAASVSAPGAAPGRPDWEVRGHRGRGPTREGPRGVSSVVLGVWGSSANEVCVCARTPSRFLPLINVSSIFSGTFCSQC